MPQAMNDQIEEYVKAIKNIYGVHLKQIILYGSYARGDFGKDSDVDLMLFVDLPEEKLNLFSDELSDLGFEYNVMHDIWFMPVVRNLGRKIVKAEEIHHESDYDTFYIASKEITIEQIQTAEQLIELVEVYCNI